MTEFNWRSLPRSNSRRFPELAPQHTTLLTVRVRVPRAAQVAAHFGLGQMRVQVHEQQGRRGHGHVEWLQLPQCSEGDRFQEAVRVTVGIQGLRSRELKSSNFRSTYCVIWRLLIVLCVRMWRLIGGGGLISLTSRSTSGSSVGNEMINVRDG